MKIHRWIFSKCNNIKKKKRISKLNHRGYMISYDTDISADTVLEGENAVGERSKLLNCKLGYASYIGNDCKFYFTEIGRYCSISNDVSVVAGRHPTDTFVSTHPDFYSVLHNKQMKVHYVKNQKFDEYKFQNAEKSTLVHIGNDVWIGEGVKIMEGITVGDGAIIGAGTIVTKDIPPYSISVGVPNRILRYRFEPEIIQKLLRIAWWNYDIAWIKEHADSFSDIKVFQKFL